MAAVEDMRVKATADLSGLIKAGEAAVKAITDIGQTVDETAPKLKKTTTAADELEASLERLAAKGRANIQAIADAALKSNTPVNTLAKNVAAFGGGVMSSKVPDYFKSIREEAVKAETALSATANKSKTNWTGLTRVIQDLPFGFVAIQNNLEQLLPASGAIGLAFSAIVAAVTFATVGFGAWNRMLGKTGEALKNTKEETDRLHDAQSKALTTVSELTENVKLAKEGFLDKKEVLKQYNDTIGKTTGKVTSLDQAEAALVKNGEAFVRMELYKAAATLAREKAAQKLVEAEEIAQKKRSDFASTVVDTRIATPGTFNAQEYDKETQRIAYAQAKRKAEAVQSAKDQAKAQTDIANKFQADAAKIAKDFKFDFFGGKETEKAKKEKIKKTTDDILAELAKAQQLIDIKELSTGKNLDPERISAIETAIKGLLDIKVSATSKTVKDLADQIAELSRPEYKKVSLFTEREYSKPVDPFPDTFDKKFHDPSGGQLKILDQIVKLQKQASKEATIYGENMLKVGDQLQGVFQDVFTDLVQGGGNALKIFAQYIEQVIVKLLAAAAVASILTAVTGGTSALGGFNSIFAQLSGFKIPGHADGVTGSPGGFAWVGERGRELVQLPQGANVIPNHRLDQIQPGMNNINVTGTIVRRGADELIFISRAQQQQNRRG